MHICFIEDTHLHGGAQILVAEVVHHNLGLGVVPVTLITPAGSCVATRSLDSDVQLATGHSVKPEDSSQLAQAIFQLWNNQTGYQHLIEKQFNHKTQFG